MLHFENCADDESEPDVSRRNSVPRARVTSSSENISCMSKIRNSGKSRKHSNSLPTKLKKSHKRSNSNLIEKIFKSEKESKKSQRESKPKSLRSKNTDLSDIISRCCINSLRFFNFFLNDRI